MPRRREVPKRQILPDPKFGDQQIAKFINMIMRNGKKSTAEKIMYFCMQRGLAFKIIESNVITLRPSLVISKEQADFILNTLEDAFNQQ